MSIGNWSLTARCILYADSKERLTRFPRDECVHCTPCFKQVDFGVAQPCKSAKTLAPPSFLKQIQALVCDFCHLSSSQSI